MKRLLFILTLFFVVPSFFLFFLVPLAYAESGDLWVADYQGGTVSHLQQNGELLNKNADVAFPTQVISDPTGGAWVLDSGHNRIVRLTDHANLFFTITGFGSLVAITSNPATQGVVAADASRGEVISYDASGHEILRLKSFRVPKALAVDKNGDLLVADKNGLKKFSSTGEQLFFIEQFTDVSDISLTLDAGAWITDETARKVIKLSKEGKILVTVTNYRRVADLDSTSVGGVYIFDRDNRRIGLLNDLGQDVHTIVDLDLSNPKHLAYDRIADVLWVSSSDALFKFDNKGKRLAMITSVKHPDALTVEPPTVTGTPAQAPKSAPRPVTPPVTPRPQLPAQETQENVEQEPSQEEQEEVSVTNQSNQSNQTQEAVLQPTEPPTEPSRQPVIIGQTAPEVPFEWILIPAYWLAVEGIIFIILVIILIFILRKRWR